MAKTYPTIQKADGTEEIITTPSGAHYKPVEYVCVYRSKTDDNNICYESSKELTDSEVARLRSEGKNIISELLGGVGCIYELVQ
jgi:hypothetical protein